MALVEGALSSWAPGEEAMIRAGGRELQTLSLSLYQLKGRQD